MTLYKVLEKLEEISPSENKGENELLDENIPIAKTSKEVTIYMSPPEKGDLTDEDSGNETDVQLSNLPGKQLLSEALINLSTVTPSAPSVVEKSKSRDWRKQRDLPARHRQNSVYKSTSADFPRNSAEVFDLFLDDDAINLFTNKTINYASQKGNHQFSFIFGEMRTFIGILLLSGYCIVPRRRSYWATKSDTYNKIVATTMSRNRFEEIMRFFHGANNANLLIEDKFAEVRLFLNILNKSFLASGDAFGSTDVSIDESTIPYYGRHPTKQFIHGKTIRWDTRDEWLLYHSVMLLQLISIKEA